MVGEILVEFGGNCSDLAEVVPGSVREVVVLDVVAHIEVEEIPDADVVVGFHPLDELVVLGDDVDGGRVGSDGGKACNGDEEDS